MNTMEERNEVASALVARFETALIRYVQAARPSEQARLLAEVDDAKEALITALGGRS